MSLLKQWQDLVNNLNSEEAYNSFWEKYLSKEQSIYQLILQKKEQTINGNLSELAEKFSMNTVEFMGFLDGINTSLTNLLELESLESNSDINLYIEFEKLYYNMLDAKADWLYNLSEWDDILTIEKRKEIKKAYNKTRIIVNDNKIGRNDPCPCGSGKKYKKCCIDK